MNIVCFRYRSQCRVSNIITANKPTTDQLQKKFMLRNKDRTAHTHSYVDGKGERDRAKKTERMNTHKSLWIDANENIAI